MGQLERYGLYVLCLVIFLILGVAIWGGDPVAASPLPVVIFSDEDGEEVPVVVGPSEEDRFFDTESSDVMRSADLFEIARASDITDRISDARGDASSRPESLVEIESSSGSGVTIHRVAEGETIGGIAESRLGSVRYAPNITKLNPGINPLRMKVGVELRLPSKASLSKEGAVEIRSARVARKQRTYKVVSNDNPYTISRKVYGTTKYGQKILEANGIKDARKIQVGALLVIPDIK